MDTIQVSEYVGSWCRNDVIVFKMRCFVAMRIRAFLEKWYPEYMHDVRVWTCKSYRMSDVKIISSDTCYIEERIRQDVFSELSNIYNDVLQYERDLNEQKI